MPSGKEAAELSVREKIGELLMLRVSASALMEEVERLAATRVILDFRDVEFMSRAFADEYRLAKLRSTKILEERNLRPQARVMIEIVTRRIDSIRTRSRARFSVKVARTIST
jgi:hypothetical protein